MATGVLSCQHVKKLPDADRALALLHEVQRHAAPLLSSRGWTVAKLYEVCCCTAGGKNLAVGGFCCPAADGRTALRIALRLRAPRTHALHPFGHVMRVMLHEITHITIADHSARFYARLDELEAEYAALLARGRVLDAAGMPTVGGAALDGSRHNPPRRQAAGLAARAAEARAAAAAARGGGVVGGGGGGVGPPAEMAARAARARQVAWERAAGLEEAELAAVQWRPRGSGVWTNFRRVAAPPPQDEEEGGEEGGEGEGEGEGGEAGGGGGEARRGGEEGGGGEEEGKKGQEGGGGEGKGRVEKGRVEVIDLTASDGEEEERRGGGGAAARERERDEARGGGGGDWWDCPRCTYRNEAADGACAVGCGYERTAHAKPPQCGVWLCRVCTCANPKAASHCTACESWRYARPL